MQNFTAYGSPSPGAPERPACWGNGNHFDQNDPDCRACRVQVSCFEQITRVKRNNVQQQQAFFPQNQVAPQQSFQQPVQQAVVPQPPQRPQSVFQQPLYPPRPQPVSQPMQQMVHQQMMHPVIQSPHEVPPGYNLGWWQDPLAYSIAANPVPFRPQFRGENAWTRAGKNILLALCEVALTQSALHIRQIVLPPKDGGNGG